MNTGNIKSGNEQGIPLLSSDNAYYPMGIPNHPNVSSNIDLLGEFTQYQETGYTSSSIGSSPFSDIPVLDNGQQPAQIQLQQNYDYIYFPNTQNAPVFDLEYIDFPEVIFKKQERKKNKSSIQVLTNGKISFTLDFRTKEAMDSVTSLKVFVKRSNDGNPKYKRIGDVEPSTEFSIVHNSKYLVKVNLDSVNEVNGIKIFELSRSKTNKNNLFYLLIRVTYNHKRVVEENTKPFKLVGKDPKPVKQQKAGQKRPHSGSNTSNDSLFPSNPNSNESGSSQSIPMSPSSDGLIKAQSVVADHIQTKTLEIDGLSMGKTISTPNGDIAYTFPIYNEKDLFEEGEIVGLVPNEVEGETYVIKKLSLNNCEEAVLKGVITRSHYLQALVKKDSSIPTETICMMGIVPVQVIGSVLPNDFLYASPYHPGQAISGYHLYSSDICDAAYIGIAVSSRKVTTEDESVGFIAAGVSVLESAGKYMLDQRLRDVEESFDGKIGVIQKSRRRSRKCIIGCGIVTTIVLLLLSIFLWQLLMPGSAYRYYVCHLGRKTNPEGSAFYHFIPYGSIYSYPRVNGIEFDFQKLMHKMHHPRYQELNLTVFNISNVHYYVNIDRCAYGQLRSTKDHVTGRKAVWGPDVFAVDDKCFHAYYFDENPLKFRWVKYNSVSWPKKKNLFCNPSSKWKNFTVPQ